MNYQNRKIHYKNNTMTKLSLSVWQKDGIAGVGNMALLEQPLAAFFASRRCSGRANSGGDGLGSRTGAIKNPADRRLPFAA